MKKIAWLILSVVLLAGRLPAQDGLRIMESQAMHSRILDQDVKYSVCLPEGYYESNDSYPVVYLLHGFGDDETAWLEYGRISQYADSERDKDAIVPMIFIMPQGYRTYYVNDYKGTFRYQDMFIKELVPFVDSIYRTLPDRQHRGLIGYSMGGFGALILDLEHPDIFGAAVPLSISIRSDDQYMAEDASEWNEQWGRLFGAEGITGPGRITDYYKQNNPFYIIPELTSSDKENFNIYIDNGDKEHTLCRSNEELHILMRNEGFSHEYRVRGGGHSFSYWCSALPNALHFLSDAFEAKPYRGDVKEDQKVLPSPDMVRAPHLIFNIFNAEVTSYLPEEYYETDRLYPVLYVAGKFTEAQQRSVAGIINALTASNETGPMLLVFLPGNLLYNFSTIYPEIENKLRIRKGYRFRSLFGINAAAGQVCEIVMKQDKFSSCVLADAYLQKDKVVSLMNDLAPEALDRTPFYIIAPDKGLYYEGNGNLHMLFRDKNIKHEYRVMQGAGGFDWMTGGMIDVIKFVAVNFHR